ncbi:NADH-quinone oxidoreductase subunit NuoH [Hirschia baltica]|uniref:NADH-quinone oxidoreductase subunit H n=1 Tax=Hirschia baltica (strain ATCC 49814 / DSM 5838 / IFAM 1418) TaxID=582402 RepID=C6XJX6_HIRBI|nr:NADH-quinone oxidoreductase subunit NuoH [Hirschia baltica]ACT59421.1 NADH dehydrogenase (quinone) [Hirschia baltica ATCC 49814]
MELFLQWTNNNPWLAVALAAAQVLAFMVVLLLAIAMLLWMDRKVLAASMLRKGPNVVGPFGLLQSFADFGKFLLKEIIIPAGANKTVFILAPIISTVTALMAWAVIPVAPGWVNADLNVGVIYLFAMSSLGVYGIIMGGWASNSKYPFLGALRSAAQMVSYEVSIGFVIVTVLMLAGSMNLSTIVAAQSGGFWNWNIFGGGHLPMLVIMFPMFVIFFVSALAETNRAPFDLPEAESELVAGYQVEYSSTPFLLYYLAEQVAIVLMCALMTVLFLGGWHLPFLSLPDAMPSWLSSGIYCIAFMVKITFLFFLFAIVRAIVPRYRYDQLMRLGWKIFLPTSLIAVIAVSAYVVFVKNGAVA